MSGDGKHTHPIPDDIIVVVPKGTRVRYIESPYVESVYVLDTAKIKQMESTTPEAIAHMLTGLPVYEAEKYEPPS